MNNPFNKKRITYTDTQKEDYVDSPPSESSAPILARAAAAWNENGDPGVNGTVNHALNAYAKVAREFKASGGKSLGGLTVKFLLPTPVSV